MPKILLIDDEVSFGEALEYRLEREGFEVERAVDGTEGLERFEAGGADLILLDLMLPGMSGEDVCRAMRKASDVPIIMLTARGEEIDRVVGLSLGADDYVSKPFSTRELIARIRAVLRRGGVGRSAPSSSSVKEGGGIRLDSERVEVTVEGRAVHLARKEFELLEVLMENSGRVLTREALIERVWGSDYYGDSRTLDVHIKRLRTKCEQNPHVPRHLLTVRGLGYKFVP